VHFLFGALLPTTKALFTSVAGMPNTSYAAYQQRRKNDFGISMWAVQKGYVKLGELSGESVKYLETDL
jgi:hypothetical protein